MKKRLTFFFLILFTGFLMGCTTSLEEVGNSHVDYIPEVGAGAIQLRSALIPQVARDNAFALDLFRKMALNTGDTNVVISPLSISFAMGMTWNGAVGTTQTEMSEMLGMTGFSDSLVNEYYEVMQKSLPVVDTSTQVCIANSLWYREGFPVKPAYLQLNDHYFDSYIRALDFSQSWAVDTINGWVDTQTNHLINSIVDNIPGDAVLYLINAVYFKGAWSAPFDPKSTYSSYFNTESGTAVKVNRMSMTDTLPYYADAAAEYLDLSYGNGAYSMTVVLPATGKTTSDVLAAMTPESLNTVFSNLTVQQVHLELPRFQAACEFELKGTLQALGMTAAFTDKADFSGISDLSLKVSRVKHKSFIEVTEEGTKAAAVTSVEVMVTSLPHYPQFIVNKPFLFFIREKGTGVILFAGKMGLVEDF
jgi:serine protease inhibitor